jgi:hypothetical protein
MRLVALVSLTLVAPGCATTQLAFTALRQIGTEPDIYQDQVLENLARISSEPTSLAYFTLLNNGVPAIADKGTMSIGSITFPAQSVVKQLHRQRGGQLGPIGVERDVSGNWTLSPINDPDRLTAMRYLYLWVLGMPLQNQFEAESLLQKYIKNFSLCMVPQGWFRCGHWKDVPKEAARKFHHHGKYYWIAPGMEENVTKLTISMLDIATVVPKGAPTQTIVWKIDPKTNKPTEIDVTRTLDYDPNPNTVSMIPTSPIALPGVTMHKFGPPEGGGGMQVPAIPVIPSPAEAATLPQRYNNYSNPLISPGLFSQPR